MAIKERGGFPGTSVLREGIEIVSVAQIMNFTGAVEVTNVSGVATINILDTDTFIELLDTPTTYAGHVGQTVRVNAGANGLIFADYIDTLLKLLDTPSSYAGNIGKGLIVNPAGTGMIFSTPILDFLGLTDTPSSYAGHGLKMVTVKSTEDGLEFSTAIPIVVGSLPGNIDFQLDDFTGVTTIAVTLSAVPVNGNCIFVYTDSGTLLKEGTDYTISGQTLTPSYDLGGIDIYVKYYSEGSILASVKEDFAGVTNVITLSQSPMDDDNLKIYTDSGTRLFKGIDRVAVGATVTFIVDQGGVAIWTGYDIAQQQIDMIMENFTAVTTSITLSNAPSSTNGIDIYTDGGTMLFEGVDRTISGSVITFVPSIGGSDIRAIYPTI